MKTAILALCTFLKGAFSETDGAPSSSRLLSAATVITSCVAVLRISFKTNALPDRLDMLALFMAAAPYTANAMRNALQSFAGKTPTP
jgi:hypothetical protein